MFKIYEAMLFYSVSSVVLIFILKFIRNRFLMLLKIVCNHNNWSAFKFHLFHLLISSFTFVNFVFVKNGQFMESVDERTHVLIKINVNTVALKVFTSFALHYTACIKPCITKTSSNNKTKRTKRNNSHQTQKITQFAKFLITEINIDGFAHNLAFDINRCHRCIFHVKCPNDLTAHFPSCCPSHRPL